MPPIRPMIRSMMTKTVHLGQLDLSVSTERLPIPFLEGFDAVRLHVTSDAWNGTVALHRGPTPDRTHVVTTATANASFWTDRTAGPYQDVRTVTTGSGIVDVHATYSAVRITSERVS